ncbi:glycosyltransferase [Lacrimispora sp. BS-2]|uniref:Glycosyltransferase n=1 Tax=Lacrimispora sp. BS-2 TaxID=3151850 RepID=A0AAU7PK97_9FIRM
MKISVCMIVKDEEDYIRECLDSVSKFAWEIIVVDTGSIDKTKEIAESFTNKIYNYPFKGNFAEARNYSLSHAKGDWILVLDADERIDYKNFQIMQHEVEMADEQVWGLRLQKYNFFKNGGWYISSALRFFKNDNVVFNGKINESVSESIKAHGGKTINSKAYINHVGHTKSFESRCRKNEQYISIFKQRLMDQEEDCGLLGYLAVLYRAQGDFSTALNLCDKGDKIINADKSLLFQLFSGHIYKGIGRFEEALKRYKQAEVLDPEDTTILSNIGVILLCMQKYKEAVTFLESASHRFPHAYYLMVNLGLAYQFDEQYDKALKCFEEAEKGNQYFAYEHKVAKLEQDSLYVYYLETIPHYAGLRYHKAYCTVLANNKL